MGGHVAHIGKEEKYMHSFGGKTMKERGHLQDLGINWRIILK
jgi:hypothetical protein